MLRIWNKFHNTTIRVREVDPGEVKRILYGSSYDLNRKDAAKSRRWGNALCPSRSAGCKCMNLTEIIVDDVV